MKKQLKGLTAYKPGKQTDEVKRELGLSEITKLASNENPFGCSPLAVEGIQSVLHELQLYPDGYATNLRKAMSEHLGVAENQLIFGNGTDELIHLLSRALLEAGTNTVYPWPTFPQYRHNAIVDGAEVRQVPLIDGQQDLEGMLAQIDEQTRLVWVCNPNNPTGVYIPEETFVAFLERVPEDVIVVSDEAYYEYVTASDYPQTIPLIERFPNLVVTRTFSKAYGLASLRVGYAIGDADFIAQIEPTREPFNVSRIAQAATTEALKDQAFIQESVEKNREGLAQYYAFCEKEGLKYYPSESNFILIYFKASGDEVFDFLLRRGFIVRSGEALGCPNSVRITIGTKEQNAAIIHLLEEFVHEH
ncbi:histidinol-phosphate transaminase [Pullulanibacillus sp. KACC 23026]|uniref:histidinol-phosphate transaminase n=1 Tax=Pullulanibacillus sp. KACC 23026 TaxID=3028315 RepID=UPI0023AE9480|nr:histidinol-phosphate transaminase [Pullulanibacillus sp. KACC 23026]WEG11364.1 histidinol-phosphate transaminase [Pullulanibacillus sp. KACC 23026]